MESMLPLAAFAECAQLSRRTIERKIASGEIAPDHVQRRRRRVFIDAAALATVAHDLSRHDVTRPHQAAKPRDSSPELISALRDSLRRERERADRAEARADISEQERREVQRQLSEVTKGIILLQRQLTPPVESPSPESIMPTRSDHTRRSTNVAPGAPSGRFSRWRFWVAH